MTLRYLDETCGSSFIVLCSISRSRSPQCFKNDLFRFRPDDAKRGKYFTLPYGVLVEYAYDAASRLTGITYKQNGITVLGDLTYEYDKNGNRTKIGGSFARTGIPQGISSTAYNVANHQTIFDNKTLTYDNNGNLTSVSDGAGTTLYAWNARNQLVGISGPTVTASFVYDGLGRRQQKTINGNSTEFLYDGVNPVQETSGAAVLANILPSLGIDEFLTRTDVVAGTTSNFLTDALGSPIAVTDAGGTVQTEYTYEPFGKTTVTGASNTNPYQYTGRENDGTGLYYYRARYYHPQLQRFVSEDPILHPANSFVPHLLLVLLNDPSALHSYGYVSNDPANLVDPLGYLGLKDIIHHPGFKALVEDMLSRLLEQMGDSPCPNKMNGLANLLAGALSALSSGNAGLWAYGVGLSTAAGFLNPVTGSIVTGALAGWSLYELLRSLEALGKGLNDLNDPCECR